MMRRLAPLLLLLLATLVAAGCGEYGQRYEGDSEKVSASGSETRVTDEKFDDAARKRDGCTDIEEFESEGNTHTTDPAETVKYEHNPPHSGDHYQVPEDWGLYDEQQPDVATVHNLEHGHILITHRGLTDKQEQTLLDHARINSYHLVVMPRKQNPKKGIYYTVWTAQIYCKEPSKAALQYMIDNWRDQGPELFTEDASGGSMGSNEKK